MVVCQCHRVDGPAAGWRRRAVRRRAGDFRRNGLWRMPPAATRALRAGRGVRRAQERSGSGLGWCLVMMRLTAVAGRKASFEVEHTNVINTADSGRVYALRASPGAGETSLGPVPRTMCPLDQLTGQVTVIDDIALVRRGRAVHAFPAGCPHGAVSLAEGVVRAGVLTCPRHGARFRLRDGRALAGPTRTPLALLTAVVRDGVVLVLDRAPSQQPVVDRLRDAERVVLGRARKPGH